MWNFKLLQKPLALLFLLCLFPIGALAQGIVKGTVNDESGEPVIGATVKVQGSSEGAITDLDGNFSVKAASNATLNISYVGYVPQQVNVGGRSNIAITLVEDNTTLNDVVVIGYGTQKKKLVTGATVQVKGDEIAKLNTTNALEAMQSSSPGVQITQSSSQPGKGYNVVIRGKGTNGDTTPLYVIDGVAGGNLDGINPADIESIDVLKDAASAAIYGARAANGVILVTTKQGKAGKIELTYNGALGWSNVYKRPQLLNAQQYMTIMDEYSFNTNGVKMDWPNTVPQDILDKVANGWEGTDWWDVFTNKNAAQQNHSVTLTGGSDRSKFMGSYTFTSNEGIMGADMASFYKRHTIRFNSDHVLLRVKDFDAITIGENISIGYNKSHDLAEDGMYWSYIHSLMQTCPLLPQFDANGNSYEYQNPDGEVTNGRGWLNAMFNHPWENLSKGGFNSMAESRNINAAATAFVVIQPIKDLKWRTQFNYNWGSGAYRNFDTPRNENSQPTHGSFYSMSQSAWFNSNWSVSNTLTYDFPIFNGHKITALLGQSFESTAWSTNLGGSNKVAYGQQLASLRDWDSAWLTNFLLENATDATLTGSPNDEDYLASWFGRVSWDWNETYMATATLRYDGSSHFADGKRWGWFPSVSAGWVVTNEPFMESTKSWMDFFKLRASWGQNGNHNVARYQYISPIILSSVGGYKFGSDLATSVAGSPSSGAYAKNVPNPDLTWETSEQLDFGFDARFLDSRMGVNFDWYRKTTKDLIILRDPQYDLGKESPYFNGGDIRNTGIELAVTWNDRIGKDFSYNVGVNFATNKNEVIRVNNLNHYINGNGGILSQGTEYISRMEEGHPIGYFYGMSYSGIWQNQAQIDAARAGGKAVLDDAQPGDCIWDDWNNDGVITHAEAFDADGNDICDRHEIGDPNPDFTLGINLGLAWKGFDFAVNGAGAFGMQVMRSYRSYADTPYQNYDTTILNRWHGDGTSNDQPRISSTGHPNTLWNSTRYMEDADYFKIKTVTLGYDFTKVWKTSPFQQLRLYVQAQNLCTFTGYTGLDPEVGSAGGDVSWASGVDLGLYPPARTFLIGASIKF
ncbi:MAG: TonB-dependent receptor [Prevotella sp.]|nr:TonB-dependent receptor [Prevotella sp.]MBR4643779.1 TonB-dependent receptor [Bacteroidaceae bacterium]